MEQPEDKAQPAALPIDTDWFLQSVVDLVNNTGMGLPITLQVSGMLVSGQVVTGEEFFEQMAIAVSSAVENEEIASDLKTFLETFRDVYRQNNESDKKSRPHFIHLKNARFFTSNSKPIPNNPTWWRGRLSEVAGFIFGTLAVS